MKEKEKKEYKSVMRGEGERNISLQKERKKQYVEEKLFKNTLLLFKEQVEDAEDDKYDEGMLANENSDICSKRSEINPEIRINAIFTLSSFGFSFSEQEELAVLTSEWHILNNSKGHVFKIRLSREE
jgi:hypothetical protein